MITVLQTDEFRKWLGRLRDTKAKAAIVLLIQRIQASGNLGSVRYLGKIGELKFDIGPGYRVYFAELRPGEITLILRGGDKATQSRDIDQARSDLSAYRKSDAT